MASLTFAASALGLSRPLERSREPACRPGCAASPASPPAFMARARDAKASSAYAPASDPANPEDLGNMRVSAGAGLLPPDSSYYRHRHCFSPRFGGPKLRHYSSARPRQRPVRPAQAKHVLSSLPNAAGPLPEPEAQPREGRSLQNRSRTRSWLAPSVVGGPAASTGRAVSGTRTYGPVDDLPRPEAHVQGAGVSIQAPAGSVPGASDAESGCFRSQQLYGRGLEASGGSQEQLAQEGTGSPLSRHIEMIQLSTLAILRSIDVLRPARERLRWSVPWKGDTIFQVMFLWFMAFWFIGSWLIPVLSQLVGLNHAAMSLRAHALYSLSTDVAEMAVGMFVLHSCLSRFRPLSAEWFHFKPRGRWYLDAVLACALFPIVQLLSQLNSSLLPVSLKLAAPAVRIENVVNVQDPVATVIYAATVAVCAPVWEEVVFRGFLLPSLTRYLPLWGSIATSAAIFSLAHFSPQRLLPLFFLGVVLGVVFARSQNLLASILSHSLWNCFVFLDLFM